MSGVLALRYRPASFADVVGQNHVKPILSAMVSSERVPPALIFTGTRGSGKTTCARIFAAALNCSGEISGDACGECASCTEVRSGSSTSVWEIDAASSGSVEEVRKIKELCLYAQETPWRVIILDECHSMSKEAYNALLKLLEEPPPNTVFVLVTTEPEKILGTVRSRSMPFEFRRLREADIVSRLQHISDSENLDSDPNLLQEIARAAQGGMRDAIMILDQITRVGITDVAHFHSFYGIADYSCPLMWAALRGDHAEGYRLVEEHFSRTGEAAGMVADLTRLVTNLLVVKSGGRPKDCPESDFSELGEMASAMDTDSLSQVCEILWSLRDRTRPTENDQRSSMEMGFALIARAVRDISVPEPQPMPILPSETVQPRLSLSEMAESTGG